MRVVITEKPSVARDIARVLGLRGKHQGFLQGQVDGEDLCIGWCFGHMAELQEPAFYDAAWKRWSPETLPMLPERFALRVRKGAEEQVEVLRGLLRDPAVTEVVNACDAGREGELIFRYLLQLADVDTPVRRLWVSSMTDAAIRQAWARLRDGAAYDPLADAARCRAEADWLVGLNATRALTCLARSVGGGQLLSVGRVQTPTLAMIVARDAEIEAFVPEDFWQVRATFQAGEGEDERLVATWFRTGGGEEGQSQDEGDDDDDKGRDGPARTTRLATEDEARAIAAACEGRTGVVVAAERKRKVEKPPLLYDLTSLQRRANQRYGLSAERTLELAQALYEKHKLLTYPRTDARHLTPDQVGELPGIVRAVARIPVYAPHATAVLERGISPGKRVVDAEEVGDHHAILPTDRPATDARLSVDEKRIYDLVARRLLAALSEDALFDLARVELAVDPAADTVLPDGIGAPLMFRARGRLTVRQGWQAVDPPKQRRDKALPDLADGAELPVVETEVKAGQTRPPRPHDDASLLKAMETAGRDLDDAALRRIMRQSGLGTPATRAAILTTLLRRGFVDRKGKALVSTERGRSLIAAVPVDELKSAELTGQWEARLGAMSEGGDARDAFMDAVRDRTAEIVAAILAAEPPEPEVIVDDRPAIGECPVCGKPVREGRAAFSCDTGRACSFVIFKKVAKREVSKRSATQLLKEGRTPVLKNFKSRKGKAFEAALVLDDEGKVRFDFPPRETPSAASPEAGDRTPPDPMTVADPVGLPCPACRQGTIIRGRTAWGCSRWREGCTWRRT